MLSSWPTSTGRGRQLAVDELYEQILGVAFGDVCISHKHLQILHTAICTESRITVSILADLSVADQDMVKTVMASLHVVLFISSKYNCVYWYHASFPDFLFTQAQAKFLDPNYPTYDIDVFCNVSAHHAVLAHQCFSIVQKSLHFNMCDLESSSIFDSDVPGLSDQIQKKLTPTLQYVSQYWARHLFGAAPAENDTNDLFLSLNNFMCESV